MKFNKENWFEQLIYNSAWSQYSSYINGWIPKFSFFVPILGYLILFNDQIVELLFISDLTGSTSDIESNNLWRLRLLYFGLIFLGLSNIFYQFFRPSILKIATDEDTYVSRALETFCFEDIQKIYLELDYFELKSDWKIFSDDFFKYSDKAYLPYDTNRERSWHDLKFKYQDFLIELLKKGFRRHDRAKSGILILCLVLSSIGYLFLAIPSIDVFLKVIVSSI